MKKPLAQSLIFHCFIAIVLVIASWGFFARKEKIPDELPITVQLMPNIPLGAKTNVKPAPKREERQATPKPPAPKPPTPKPPTPKPLTPVKAEPVKPATKPALKPAKTEPKKDDLNKMLEELDKKEKPKPKEKTQDTSDLDSLLKNFDKKPAARKSSEEKNTDANSNSQAKFDENAPVSQSVVDYISKLITDQIKSCWSPPAGVMNAQNLVVRVNVDISQAGVMKFVGFEGAGSGDPMYRVAQDAARRAVLDPECNPLRQLPPPDKYNVWKEMTLIFDPKDLNY